MKIIQIVFVLMMLGNIKVNGQCKEIKLAMKAMNVSDIDSSQSSLKAAEVLIVENGIETISEKCLVKYHYTKAAVHLVLGQKEDSLKSRLALFDVSKEYYEKFLKIEQSGELYEMVMSNLLSLSIEYSNVGVEYYQDKKFDSALVYMEKGIQLKERHHPGKTKPIDQFNAMVCAKMVEQYTKALTYADSLLARPKLTRDDRITYMGQKVEILTAADKSDEALDLIDSLKKLDPTDQNLKLAELQIYLNKDQNIEALKLLNEITKNTKNREDLWVIKGQLHYHQSEVDSSIKSFSNALILNENSYPALYGLGVIYVNRGNKSIRAMNASDGEEKLMKEENVKMQYGVAIGYLMKILAFKPNDVNTLETLKMIYHSLGDIENEGLIDEKIKEVEN